MIFALLGALACLANIIRLAMRDEKPKRMKKL